MVVDNDRHARTQTAQRRLCLKHYAQTKHKKQKNNIREREITKDIKLNQHIHI